MKCIYKSDTNAQYFLSVYMEERDTFNRKKGLVIKFDDGSTITDGRLKALYGYIPTGTGGFIYSHLLNAAEVGMLSQKTIKEVNVNGLVKTINERDAVLLAVYLECLKNIK